MAYGDDLLTGELDWLAAAYNVLAAVFGDGSGSTTLSARAAALAASFEAAQDLQANANMAPALLTFLEETKAASTSPAIRNGPMIALGSLVRALRAQLGGGIDATLSAKAIQVHPYAALVIAYNGGGAVSPANIFSLVTEMGHVDRAGGTWTFSHGTGIDRTRYAPAQLEVYIPTGYTSGPADDVLALTCLKADDTTQQKQVTVPANSPAGTRVDVGAGADRYVDATAISVTGGTDGDRVAVRSKQLRSLPW